MHIRVSGSDRGGVAAKRGFEDARELAVAVWDVPRCRDQPLNHLGSFSI
jgi:hypothetical protein